MSKKFTNVVLTVLTFVCVLCMSIATLGLGNASADTVSTFSMINGAQVRTQGVSGIRFAATMSADDYDTLKKAGAKFGMIIAPSDYVEKLANKDADFKRGVMDAYDGTGTQTVFYNWAECNPVVDFGDYDEDGDESEYVLTCSFVGIKDYNFSRTFKARAYYEIDGQYYHTENITERTIYTVASKYLANTTFDLDDDAQVATKDYVTNIVDKVNEVYTDYQVTVDGITDGVAYRDDKISVTANVSNGTRTIEAGAKLVLTQEGEEVEEGLAYNVNDGDYTIATSGKFSIVAQNGAKVGGNVPVTVKRHGVEVSILPGTIVDGGSWSSFQELANTSKVTVNDFTYNKVDSVGNSVRIKPIVTDAENADAKIDLSGISLVGDPEWFGLGSYGGQIYLANRDLNKKINPLTKVVATYTDGYGIEYTAEIPVYGSDDVNPVYFGKDQDRWTATDSLILELRNYQWLTIEDVPLTASNLDSLIEFTLVHVNAANKGRFENKMWQFIISESGNPENWIRVGVGNYSTNYVAVAMNTPKWSKNYLGYALRSGGFKTLKNEPDNNNPGWFNADSWFANRSFAGNNQWWNDAENYRGEMMGLRLYNSELFFSAGWKNGTSWKWNDVTSAALLPKSSQTAANILLADGSTASSDNDVVFTGFDGFNANGKKVDISILPSNFKAGADGATCKSAMMVIDKLGGQKVTADWMDKVYYSYSSTGMPNLFAD